ncbi:zinc finger MYM-type protein 1-like [Schistocerca piceifrons]|uniref:zinc finger MYM-type protein 1-like n=1 Tax=Schistocerca piceifrons TaxID=274613 RepID=UPI001F5FCF41|nr:zinc finger MYM-type protein 1-like [Schistocerca piceifrons]
MTDIHKFFVLHKRMKTTNENGGVEEDTVYDQGSGILVSIPDVGNYIEKKDIDNCLKYKILLNPWQPEKSYYFKNDIDSTKRTFRPDWLSLYPWLVYSKAAKGALCRFCVLFHPRITHVEELAYENLAKLGQTNRAKLKSVVSCVLFCALHDLPLRGKTNSNAVFDDLLQFRVQSGDETFRKRFEGAPKNATYVSHRTQNDLIDVYAEVLRNDLINTINNSESFSVLADETMDIAGTEQLSLSACYFDLATDVVREDFLGFTPLARLDAKHISNTIISTLSASGLNLDKMVGQGHDGCSTMAGKIGGVQKIIAEKYPKASFYHCAIHRLNLVVNDLNTLPEAESLATLLHTFIVTLKVIAKYSAKLEPVTNILQSVNINLLEVSDYIQGIVKMLLDDKENAEGEFEMIMKSAQSNDSALGIDVTGI